MGTSLGIAAFGMTKAASAVTSLPGRRPRKEVPAPLLPGKGAGAEPDRVGNSGFGPSTARMTLAK